MIQWLTTLKSSKEIVHLSRHLKSETQLYVLTSKPVPGLPSHLISESNVEQKPQPQYLIEKVHQIDSSKMFFRTTENCIIFQKKYDSELKPFFYKLNKPVTDFIE